MPADKAPNYFEMLQGFLQPFAQSGGSAMPNFPILDPKELEKKIAEMETVLLWLKAQTGVVELSVETMKVQLTWLKEWQSKTADSGSTGSNIGADVHAKFAEAFDPAKWAWNQMPGVAKPAAASSATAKKPRSSAKKKR